MTVVPPSLLEVADRVECRVRTLLEPERARWSAFDPSLAAPLAVLAAGAVGWQAAPAGVRHWGFVGAGGDPDDPMVVDAGAAFELMHAFALFHDDVMDDAASRRGEPTTHTVFAEQHAAGGWAGESRRFGEGVAILVGDLAFVYADQLLVRRLAAGVGDLERAAHRAERRPGARHRRDVRNDQRAATRPSASAATRAASTPSSGRCTSARSWPRPTGPTSCCPALSAYGLPLGDAFQMRDDVHGRVRRPGRHRQAGRRRPPRGQAHAAARPRAAAATPAQPRCSTRRSRPT